MPHHSQQNPLQSKNLDGPSSLAEYCKGQQSFHNSPRSDNEVVKRNQATNIWMTQSADSAENQQQQFYKEKYHRVPSSPPESVGSASQTQNSGLHGCNSACIQSKRDPTQEIASVLLMAAAAATSVKETSTLVESKNGGSRDIEATDSQGNRPLKKRKSTDLSYAKAGTNPDESCHISPISYSSKSGTTVETNIVSHDTPSTSSAHSFDMKDDCNSNIAGTRMKANQSNSQPQNSMYQMIPQFPSLVHWILSEPSFQPSSTKCVDLSVLQWVSHGQAWRIIRWDAFHREVLPALFPQLVSNITDSGSIDAFMWQLKAWGFQEIKDGPDIGAFAHTLFRRGHPKMCEEMAFMPSERATSTSMVMETRSILRVPSLNSSTSTSIARPNELPEERSSLSSISIIDFTGSPLHHHTNKFPARHQLGPPAYVNYRPDEMNLTSDGWQFSNKYHSQEKWPNTTGTMPSRKMNEMGQQTISPYSPIRIRSSRGVPRRLSLRNSVSNSPSATTSQLDYPSSVTSFTQGFPVSNRGKGRLKIVASSSNSTKDSSVKTNDEVEILKNLKATNLSTLDDSQQKSNEGKFSSSVLKRKLPLMVPSSAAGEHSKISD